MSLAVSVPTTTPASDTDIAISASTTGGSGTYQYQFVLVGADGKTYVLQDYSSSSTCNWNTSVAGSKTLTVNVKDSEGNVTSKSTAITVSKALTATLNVPDTTPSANTSLALSASASGGSGTYQYQYVLTGANGKKYILQDYSTTSTYTWNTSVSGSKLLTLNVKDSNGTIVSKNVSIEVGGVLTATLKASSTTPAIGSTVTLSASASGGSGSYTYEFLYINSDGMLTVLQDYSASATCTVAAVSAGTSRVMALVKDSSGTILIKQLTLTVS